MVEEFRRVWQLAGLGEKFIVIGEEALAVDSYELAAPTGMPGNYLLVARSRDADGAKRVVVVTEAGVEAGRFNPERQVFEFLDRGNQPAAIQLRSGGAVVVPEILCSPQAKKPETVFAVVQEGGSSTELYVHQFDQAEDAQQYRVDSWKDGAYRTSPVVEVPLSLADHPEFNTVVENLLKAALEVDGVEGKG
jgi:hypothetical protein